MKYRKIKYIKDKNVKKIHFERLYTKNKTKGLIATYYTDSKKMVCNYNINNLKINSPKSYAIKIATLYIKKDNTKIINNDEFIFNIKDLENNVIYGPYILTSLTSNNKGIMYFLENMTEYKIKNKYINKIKKKQIEINGNGNISSVYYQKIKSKH